MIKKAKSKKLTFWWQLCHWTGSKIIVLQVFWRKEDLPNLAFVGGRGDWIQRSDQPAVKDRQA